MVELSVRLFVAGLAVFLAGTFKVFDFDFAWKVSAAFASVSLFSYLLERRDMKTPGIAGFFAIADCIYLALILQSANMLNTLGFLVLAPCAYAAAKYGTMPSLMAPLAAASLIAADAFSSKTGVPSMQLLAQTAGILAIGLMFTRDRVVVVTETPEGAEPIETPEPKEEADTDAFLELRENYRKLRDAYRDLEIKSEKETNTNQLASVSQEHGDKFFIALGKKLKELTGVSNMVIYTLAQFADTMVIRSTSGDIPKEITEQTIDMDLDLAPGQIKHRIEKALLAIQTPESRKGVANILMMHKGRIQGMLVLLDTDSQKLEQARETCEEIAPYAAEAIAAETQWEMNNRRLKEAELLYEISSLGKGATTLSALAGRFCRELFDLLSVDHVGAFYVDGDNAVPLANEGAAIRIIETMQFPQGVGLKGWLDSGAPEMVLFDAKQDGRCSTEEVVKKRVGSFYMVRLGGAEAPIGFLTVATHGIGGIDNPQLDTLRIVSAEMGQAFDDLITTESKAQGMMAPKEFLHSVKDKNKGFLVYLEPLRKESLTQTFGKPAFLRALRQFGQRVRAKLPPGGSMCRRQEGDFIVFIPSDDATYASSWANEICAMASMIGVQAQKGSAKMPFGMRAKTAHLAKQHNEVFEDVVA